jgi:chemotaxis protein histidine kinase CheA
MAEKVVIEVEVAGEQRVLKSMKDIKQAKKDLAEASVFGDKKAAKALADLNDKLEETGDAVKTLKGSGIEKVSGSFGQLGEGLKNMDFDKIKTGFKGLGAAMKAVPVFLIVEGIMYLVQNFEELSKGSGVLAKALQFVGDILSAIGDGLTWLTDNLGFTNSALDEMGEKAVEMAEKGKEAISAQSAEYDRLAKEAKMSGESAVKYEIAKQQAIIDTNTAVLKQLLLTIKAGKELTEEESKLLTSSTAALKQATTDRNLIIFNSKEEQKKKDKEAYDNWSKLQEQKKAASQKEADDLFAQLTKNADADKEATDRALEREKKQEEDRAKLRDEMRNQQIASEKAANAEMVKNWDEAEKQKTDAAKVQEDARKQAQVEGLNAAQNLSQAFFAIQLNRAKGNATAEIAIKKKMFAVDKAFNVARAIQDGIRSVQAALTIPPPGGQILAGINAGLAAANVAKILATKFEGGSVADVSVPTANVSTNAPNINTNAPTTQVPQTTTTTRLGENGQNLGQRVYVLESDISKSQNRVARLNEQATV